MANWWDPEGASLSVWAAYNPYEANSQAHSYMDVSGNGNDVTAGTAPGWANGSGWTFTAASSQYLVTTFAPANDQSQTVIVQFSGVDNNGYLFGCIEDANEEFWIIPDDGASAVEFANGQADTDATVHLEGNLALAGDEGYKDGVALGLSMGAWAGSSTTAAYIGAYNNNGGGAAGFLNGTIKLMVIYDVALTDAQVAAVVDAMRLQTAPDIAVSVWDGSRWSALDARFEDTINALCIGAQDGYMEAIYDIYVGLDETGTAQVSGSVTVTNDGTARAWPKLVISRSGGGEAIITSLRNETTGEWVAFNYPLLDGETLEIDFQRRWLTSSFAGSVMSRMLAGDLFALQSGSNTITFFVKTTPEPTIEAYLTHTEAYLSAD